MAETGLFFGSSAQGTACLVDPGREPGCLRLSGAESPGRGAIGASVLSSMCMCRCKTWSWRLAGEAERGSHSSRRAVPTGQGDPPHEPGSAPPPSQLLPGAGEGGTGRPGPRRTPGKGRKAGVVVVGRKKFWGVTGKPGTSFGGDSEGAGLGEDWRPVEGERLGQGGAS